MTSNQPDLKNCVKPGRGGQKAVFPAASPTRQLPRTGCKTPQASERDSNADSPPDSREGEKRLRPRLWQGQRWVCLAANTGTVSAASLSRAVSCQGAALAAAGASLLHGAAGPTTRLGAGSPAAADGREGYGFFRILINVIKDPLFVLNLLCVNAPFSSAGPGLQTLAGTSSKANCFPQNLWKTVYISWLTCFLFFCVLLLSW